MKWPWQSEFTAYRHHDKTVWVRRVLKGRHRQHCLCYACALFVPENREENCPIANDLYAFDCERGVTTPVWECASFISLAEVRARVRHRVDEYALIYPLVRQDTDRLFDAELRLVREVNRP